MSPRNIMVSLAAIAGGASIFFALRGHSTSGALFRRRPAIRPLSITDGIGALE
jgi:hypothetical protein